MQCVHAAKFSVDGEPGGVFDQPLLHFDNSERRPLIANDLGGSLASAQSDGSDGLDEADAAHEPVLGSLHSVEDEVASRLGDVALDQRARVKVEVQRSASRSANTSPEALRSLFTGRGVLGRVRAGATNRPWL